MILVCEFRSDLLPVTGTCPARSQSQCPCGVPITAMTSIPRVMATVFFVLTGPSLWMLAGLTAVLVIVLGIYRAVGPGLMLLAALVVAGGVWFMMRDLWDERAISPTVLFDQGACERLAAQRFIHRSGDLSISALRADRWIVRCRTDVGPVDRGGPTTALRFDRHGTLKKLPFP